MSDDVIWIVTDEPNPLPDGTRGSDGRNPFGEPGYVDRTRRQPVSTEALEQNMGAFLQRMGRVLTQAKMSAGELAGMTLDEIELSVEVNGEGKVSLLGTGASVGTKGAMTLKFKANR